MMGIKILLFRKETHPPLSPNKKITTATRARASRNVARHPYRPTPTTADTLQPGINYRRGCCSSSQVAAKEAPQTAPKTSPAGIARERLMRTATTEPITTPMEPPITAPLSILTQPYRFHSRIVNSSGTGISPSFTSISHQDEEHAILPKGVRGGNSDRGRRVGERPSQFVVAENRHKPTQGSAEFLSLNEMLWGTSNRPIFSTSAERKRA